MTAQGNSSTVSRKQRCSLNIYVEADSEEELIKQLLSLTHSIKHGATTIEAQGRTMMSKAVVHYGNGT